MRLDERAWDAAWKVWLDCADVQQMDRDSALKQAIETYLSSTVPVDVRELVGRMEPHYKFIPMLEEAATALLSLSAENAELKARLAGTAGVEILEK